MRAFASVAPASIERLGLWARRASVGVTMLVALLTMGCSTVGPRAPSEAPAKDLDSVNVGYTLLYAIVSGQKHSDKAFIIKRVSPQMRSLVEEISRTAGAVDEELKRMAKADPAIQLDRRVLPLIEAKRRESGRVEAAKEFLETSGKPFERLMLLGEWALLWQERHLARTMREAERNPARKAFWEATLKRFDDLYFKVGALLEKEYFAH